MQYNLQLLQNYWWASSYKYVFCYLVLIYEVLRVCLKTYKPKKISKTIFHFQNTVSEMQWNLTAIFI